MPVVTGHRPDLLVTPLRLRQRMFRDDRAGGIPGRLRLRTLHRPPGPRLGLPTPPDAFEHIDQLHEPRGSTYPPRYGSPQGPRRAPNRPSAPFSQTRNSTATSPSARVSSATSSSNYYSRLEGPGPAPLNPSFTTLKELALPVPDRLLRHLPTPGPLSNRDLALEHRQHDADLLLH